jgi:hypothetical protein
LRARQMSEAAALATAPAPVKRRRIQ